MYTILVIANLMSLCDNLKNLITQVRVKHLSSLVGGDKKLNGNDQHNNGSSPDTSPKFPIEQPSQTTLSPQLVTNCLHSCLCAFSSSFMLTIDYKHSSLGAPASLNFGPQTRQGKKKKILQRALYRKLHVEVGGFDTGHQV